MLTVRDHNVEDHATLRDMDATDVAVLDEADGACLDQLGQYRARTKPRPDRFKNARVFVGPWTTGTLMGTSPCSFPALDQPV